MSLYPLGRVNVAGCIFCTKIVVRYAASPGCWAGDTKGTVWREAIAAWGKLGPHPYPLPLAFLTAH